MEFLFAAFFLVDFLDAFVLDAGAAGLDLNFTDRAIVCFLALVRSYEDTDAVKLVIVAVLGGRCGLVWVYCAEVIDAHAIAIGPVFAFEFIARYSEVNPGNPSVLDRVFDLRLQIAE